MFHSVQSRAGRIARRAIPADGDIVEMCAAISRFRGRPIILAPVRMLPAASLSGAWLPLHDRDVIAYAASTPAREEVSICHEIAHMLLGHEPALEGTSPREVEHLIHQVIAPNLNIDPDRFMLRDGYDTVAERDAEQLGRRIATWAELRQARSLLTLDRVSDLIR